MTITWETSFDYLLIRALVDESQSSTYNDSLPGVSQGSFVDEYADLSTTEGDWFVDVFTVGDASVSLQVRQPRLQEFG